MRDHGPGCSQQACVHGGCLATTALANGDREIKLILLETGLRRRSSRRRPTPDAPDRCQQTSARYRDTAVPVVFRGTRQRFFMLAIRQNGGVACFGRLVVQRIIVSRALVLCSSQPKVFALKQNFCQQEVGVRAIRFAREIREVLCGTKLPPPGNRSACRPFVLPHGSTAPDQSGSSSDARDRSFLSRGLRTQNSPSMP